jgi:hypothetical protein
MTAELILPRAAVNERLGIREPVGVKLAPRDVGINLRRLNVDDPSSPAYGKWVDRAAVLRWMQFWEENTGGSEVLSKMISEYKTVLEIE